MMFQIQVIIEWLSCWGGINAIVQKFQQLDPDGSKGLDDDSVRQLVIYAEAAKKRCLKEYLMADRYLGQEIGGRNFGPSKWHTDASIELYQAKWDEALAILKTIRQNPHAEEIYNQFKTYLKGSANWALENIAYLKPNNYE